jgi:hypothetical protein
MLLVTIYEFIYSRLPCKHFRDKWAKRKLDEIIE